VTDFKPLFTWRSAIVESDLHPTVRHIALTLSLHMNERGGSCFPSLETQAQESGRDVATVKRALSKLEEAGYLKRIRPQVMGRGHRTEYEALVPEGAQDAPVSEERGAGDRESGASDSENWRTDAPLGLQGVHQEDVEPASLEDPENRKAHAAAFSQWHERQGT
jgi:DNA-binding transcriptional MocR family regulator